MSARQAPEPRLGPETGDVLDFRDLADLEFRRLERLALSGVTPPLPRYTGPVTGAQASLADLEAMAGLRVAQALTEAIPVVPEPERPARRGKVVLAAFRAVVKEYGWPASSTR